MQAISVLTVPHFIYSLPAKFTKHPKTLGRQFDKKIIILETLYHSKSVIHWINKLVIKSNQLHKKKRYF